MLIPVWIAVATVILLLAARFADWIPYAVGAITLFGAGAWILVSVLWPSAPDRTCPRCKEPGLVKIRRGRPGVRCERCGFRDETLHVSYLDDW